MDFENLFSLSHHLCFIFFHFRILAPFGVSFFKQRRCLKHECVLCLFCSAHQIRVLNIRKKCDLKEHCLFLKKNRMKIKIRWQLFSYSHCSIDLCKSTICSEQYCNFLRTISIKAIFFIPKSRYVWFLYTILVFTEYTVFSFLQVQIYQVHRNLLIVMPTPPAWPPASS